MKKTTLIILTFIGLSLSSYGQVPSCEPISNLQLKDIISQLGYEIKDISSTATPKYQVKLNSAGLDIPISAEISASGKFIWLLANLGPADSLNTTKSFNLLKQNGKIQPGQFYVSSIGKLMYAMPIENRGVNNVVLRQKLESVATNVGSTQTIWK